MRTAYLGTSEFAVAILERLARSPHRPALVVTRPDRPKGRGRKLVPPPVAESARALGIELLQPESVNADEARAAIAAARPEAVCICAYGALLKEPLLSAHEMLNVHPSLLPRWRGAAPIERAIEAGDEVTGVTIMRPVAELDAGPTCLQRTEPIHSNDDFGTLSARLAELSGELLVEALDGGCSWSEQPANGITYAEKIDREDRALDPALDAAALERRIRALNPHVGTFIERDDGDRLGVRRAALAHPTADLSPGQLAARDDQLLYGTTSGALALLEVQPPGGRPMDVAAYLRGYAASL
jgi:methionyl-tRNA formyltransferase